MSATTDTPLGGFEQRLLSQLKLEVAARPAAPAAARARVLWPRVPAAATALIAALVVAVLSVLPAAAPSLAQAFPILDQHSHPLPASLARVLRSQWQTRVAPRFDLEHAYAFSTPAGTGYVIVDQRSRWLCILVPGFSDGGASGRCERVAFARAGEPALAVRIGGPLREEVVALLPRGSNATTGAPSARARNLVLRHGVLAVVSRRQITLLTTVDGRRSVATYAP